MHNILDDQGAIATHLASVGSGAFDTQTIRPQDSSYIRNLLRQQMGGLTRKPQPYGLDDVHIPDTQRAIVTPEVGPSLDLHLSTVAVRPPNVGEVLVRIQYSGICRSDASFSTGPAPGYPCNNHIAGHEGIGHIVSAFDPVLLGRQVAIRYLGESCQSCVYCQAGIQTSCPSMTVVPRDVPGTWQEYVTLPTSCVTMLPDSLFTKYTHPARYAAALCSGSTALRALQKGHIKAGDVVIILGIAGAIGHLAGAMAKHVFGATVIGIDLAEKIQILSDLALDIGDVFLSAPGEDRDESRTAYFARVAESCAALRGGGESLSRGADCVIVAASSTEAFEDLDKYVCDGGRIVCVGVPKDQGLVSISVNALVERNLHVCGTLMGGACHAIEVLQYIASGRITPYVTEVRLDEIPGKMQDLLDHKTIGKVVVKINGTIGMNTIEE